MTISRPAVRRETGPALQTLHKLTLSEEEEDCVARQRPLGSDDVVDQPVCVLAGELDRTGMAGPHSFAAVVRRPIWR